MTTLKIICDWCRRDMGEKDGGGQSGETGGMCPDCWAKLFPGEPYPREEEVKDGKG